MLSQQTLPNTLIDAKEFFERTAVLEFSFAFIYNGPNGFAHLVIVVATGLCVGPDATDAS